MNTKFIFTLGFIVASFWSSVFSQTNAPKYSNEFLTIGVGARNFGMANSVVAGIEDVTAGYYNPAGLLHTKKDMEFGLMHSEYFKGIAKYDYFGFSKRLDENSVGGISFIRFGTDDIPNTTQLIDKEGNINYDNITRFSAADYALLLSYARRLKMGLEVGGNFKIIHRRIGDLAKSWGFGLDLSANYRTEKWKFAAVLRDVTTTVNAWSYSIDEATREVFEATGNEIPENSTEITLPRLIVGASREVALNEKFELTAEMNLNATFDGKRNTIIRSNGLNVEPSLGLELGFKKLLFVRTGFGNVQWIRQFDKSESLSIMPSIGVGVAFKKFQIDYAISNIGNGSLALYSNVFSLSFGLN
ncbi:MAG: PorV/PorQ family protein [Flavobacteriales bacterium]